MRANSDNFADPFRGDLDATTKKETHSLFASDSGDRPPEYAVPHIPDHRGAYEAKSDDTKRRRADFAICKVSIHRLWTLFIGVSRSDSSIRIPLWHLQMLESGTTSKSYHRYVRAQTQGAGRPTSRQLGSGDWHLL